MRGLARTAAALATLALVSLLLSVPASAAPSSPVPADVRFVSRWTDPLTGLRWDRYQQYAAPLGVFVDGAQLTVMSRGSQVVDVSGEHYPGLRVSVAPDLSPAQAVSAASARAQQLSDEQQSAVTMKRSAQLRVDPQTGREFYRVTSAAPGVVLYQDIDANTGAVLQSWNGIEQDSPPTGTGVKGDTKNLGGDVLIGPGNVLTSPTGSGTWQMVSANQQYQTSDANNKQSYPSTPMTDADNTWTGSRQFTAVDAQYYAALTDNFYETKFDFDLNGDQCLDGPIDSIVHYRSKYANAFWDPEAHVMVYGDGDGTTLSQMSGAQDVVSHELSHAVTSCQSDLDYNRESGALNEAFSDIMGTTAEFESLEPNTSNCVRETTQPTCADWWLGEDLIIGGSDHAIRSLAHPQVLGQPSHYSQRIYQGSCSPNSFNDECGVHTNSGIANHAFYLLAHGGRNARCSGPTDPQADCDVVVPGIGIDHASHIFLDGYFQLTNTAKFCDARSASINAAQMIVDAPTAGYTQDDVAATELAWDAVGVYCPTLAPFHVTAGTRSAAAKPGGSVQVNLSVSRNGSTDPITFSLDSSAPATSSFAPPTQTGTTSVTLQLDVAADAPPGVYPMTATATDGTSSQKVPLVLIVDTDAPTAIVSGVALATGDQIPTNGKVPLHVSWTTSDPTSGVASGALSVDTTQVATGVSGPTTYSSADGTHQFQALATDQAGNVGSSTTFVVSQTTATASAAALTKTWTNSSAGAPWGTTKFSKTKGATATYQFTGTDIAWVSARGPKRGIAKVYIDGVQKALVDLKASSSKSSVIVFTATGLGAGPHTIEIYVKGTSGRPRVDVDGFVVLSQ